MSALLTPLGDQVKKDLQDTGPPLQDRSFRWTLFAALSVGIITLVALLVFVVWEGYPRLTPTLWQEMPSIRFPEKAGAQSAIMGSIWVIVTTALICLPVGIMAAIYLEEYGNEDEPVLPVRRDQHPEPGRCAVDRLRHPRLGCDRPGAGPRARP